MKDNATELLKHFFLEIGDNRKETFGEEYEPATLPAYKKGLRRYFLERRKGENYITYFGDDTNLSKNL